METGALTSEWRLGEAHCYLMFRCENVFGVEKKKPTCDTLKSGQKTDSTLPLVLYPAGPPWSWPYSYPMVLRSERAPNGRLWPSQSTRPNGAWQFFNSFPELFALVVQSSRAQQAKFNQDSPRRECVSHPGSSQWEVNFRGTKRVMATDIPDSLRKRRIRENDSLFL